MPRRKPPHYSYYGLLPNSTPAWRWDRANQLIQLGKKRSLKRDGPDVYRMIGFLRRTLDDFTGYGVKQMLKEDPKLVMAVRLRTESGPRELEIQLRALAGESARVIAVEVGSTKDIIETYCRFFFDVPGRLEQTGYIRHRVTQVPLDGSATLEALAKLSCYNHGPAAIPPWMDYLQHFGQMHDLTTELGRQREAIELYVDAMNLKLTADSVVSFTRRAGFIYQLGEKVFRERNAGALIRQNVHRMLSDSVVWLPEPTGYDFDEIDRNRPRAAKRSVPVTAGGKKEIVRAI